MPLPFQLGTIYATKALTEYGQKIFSDQSKKLAKNILLDDDPEWQKISFYAFYYLLLESANLLDHTKTKINDFLQQIIELVRELIKGGKN